MCEIYWRPATGLSLHKNDIWNLQLFNLCNRGLVIWGLTQQRCLSLRQTFGSYQSDIRHSPMEIGEVPGGLVVSKFGI